MLGLMVAEGLLPTFCSHHLSTGHHGSHFSRRGWSGSVRRRGEKAGAALEDEDPEADMEGYVDVGNEARSVE